MAEAHPLAMVADGLNTQAGNQVRLAGAHPHRSAPRYGHRSDTATGATRAPGLLPHSPVKSQTRLSHVMKKTAHTHHVGRGAHLALCAEPEIGRNPRYSDLKQENT